MKSINSSVSEERGIEHLISNSEAGLLFNSIPVSEEGGDISSTGICEDREGVTFPLLIEEGI